MRRRYGYRPRRSRPRQGAWWWIALPLVLVTTVVLLNPFLPADGSGRAKVSPACPAGENCGPAVLAWEGCAAGAGCPEPQGGPSVTNVTADAGPDEITAQAAAVVEEPCGALLYSDDPHERRPPASVAKIMTALVALEQSGISSLVDVQVDGAELSASTDSTVMGLEPGQRLTLRDLLYGLLLPSGNDAAVAIAEHVAGSVPAFVAMMNSKAAAMGLGDTHFTNPHGLDDPDLHSSALDMARLGAELMRQPELAAIVSTRSYQPAWDGPTLWNGNRLLYLYPEALGVKIGYTDTAGQTIVAAAERDGRRMIASVLGSSDVYQDAITLLEWAFNGTAPACAG